MIDVEPPVGLQRYVGWPGADGHIHISIYTTLEPGSLTDEIATRDAHDGLARLGDALDADPRLGTLMDKFGTVRKYVYDYGHGAVAVGDVGADGTVTLY